MRKSLLAIFTTFVFCSNAQTGTWTQVTNLAPHLSGGGMQLLTDGTILCKSEGGGSDGFGNIWDKLTPDANGSYINGTWSSIAPMTNTRLYFSSQVLKDGRVYVAGGEYGTGKSAAEVYNPVTNTWTSTPAPGGVVSDANSMLMPDGRVMQAMVNGSLKTNLIYNPTTNSFSPGPSCVGIHNESSWVKQADNSFLFIDRNALTSERYIPATNTWIADATVPVPLYDPYGLETGAALLLPDGRSFFMGSTSNTAYYTPSGTTSPGSWAAGPLIPGNRGVPDGAAAMMIDGKILCVATPSPISSNHFPTPSTFYEFNYLTNTFTALSSPPGVTPNQPCYIYNMIVLPDGKVLLSEQDNNRYWVYTPFGSQLAAGTPTVSSIIQASCTSFTATGMLFNGISEGACYGDDWQMATNYPIIRLTQGSNVYYAKTFNWNSTGVRRGTAPDSTQFSLPPGLLPGTYSLQVIANGIASAPVTFIPFPILTTTLVPGGVCSNTTFSYTATSPVSGATFAWTRPAVAGISNAAITSSQTSNPNEVLINTTASPINVNYIYTITANGCSNTQSVSVTVNPSPTLSIAGTTTICLNATTLLTASGASTYTWNTTASGNTISVTPTTTTVYSVTGSNSFGCNSAQQTTVTVNPLPTIMISGVNSICINDSAVLSVSGGTSYVWSNSSTSTSITVTPTTTSIYSVSGTDMNGCTNSQNYTVTVNQLPIINISGTNSICLNDSTILTAGGATTYTWNTSSNSASITVTPSSTSVYTVNGTDGLGCSSSQTTTITVNPLPVLSLSSTGTICTGNTATINISGANTYTWSTGSNANSVIVSPTVTTYYSVSGTDGLGCNAKDSVLITVNACVGVNELSLNNNNAIVFPNPAQEQITVLFNTNETGTYTISIIDVYGRIVKNDFDSAVSGENSHTVLLNDMAKGLYFIIVRKGNHLSKTKIVVE